MRVAETHIDLCTNNAVIDIEVQKTYAEAEEGERRPSEDRRRHALALFDDGLSLNEAGRRTGCNPSSVSAGVMPGDREEWERCK
jgi:hypothetical protein